MKGVIPEQRTMSPVGLVRRDQPVGGVGPGTGDAFQGKGRTAMGKTFRLTVNDKTYNVEIGDLSTVPIMSPR